MAKRDENMMIISANLTKNAEERVSADGKSIVHYTVAQDVPYARQGKPSVLYMNCTVFDQEQGQVAMGFKQGDRVRVVGRIYPDSYKRKADGVDITDKGIIVDMNTLIARKKAGQEGSDGQEAADGMNAPEEAEA